MTIPRIQLVLLVTAAGSSFLRFLNDKLKETFKKKGLFFQAYYVTSVRDWCGNFATYGPTYGAYRKRKANDDKVIPHSFTFIRRDCA